MLLWRLLKKGQVVEEIASAIDVEHELAADNSALYIGQVTAGESVMYKGEV